MNREYILNKNVTLNYKGATVLTPEDVAKAMNFANNALRE